MLPVSHVAPAPRDGAELDAALDAGLLTVVYQPVVDLLSGRVVAVEALARLREPDTGGLLAADLFIPLAEATGRISRIDRLVLEAAVPQAARWRQQLGLRSFGVAVNLSVGGLTDRSLPGRIRERCMRAGLPLDALVVEVTETVLSAPGRGHGAVLRAISALGCNVTMDDFGTGFSSLSHLKRFPVDGIKIDRQFVRDLDRGGRGADIARAMVAFGAILGVQVVAEGVETVGQLAALRAAGAVLGQGYLFSRPLPPEQLTRFLHRTSAVVPLPHTAAGPVRRGEPAHLLAKGY